MPKRAGSFHWSGDIRNCHLGSTSFGEVAVGRAPARSRPEAASMAVRHLPADPVTYGQLDRAGSTYALRCADRSGWRWDTFENDHRKDAVGVLFVRGGPVGDLRVEPVAFGALKDDGIRLVGGVSDLDDDRRVRAEVVEPRGVLWGTGLGRDHEHPAVVDRVPQGDGAGPARPSPGSRQQQDREGRLNHGATVGPELVNDAP